MVCTPTLIKQLFSLFFQLSSELLGLAIFILFSKLSLKNQLNLTPVFAFVIFRINQLMALYGFAIVHPSEQSWPFNHTL